MTDFVLIVCAKFYTVNPASFLVIFVSYDVGQHS